MTTRYRRYRLADGSVVAARFEDDEPVAAGTDIVALADGVADAALLAKLRGALDADDAAVIAPTTPTKVVCIGLNYHRHAAEMGKPLPEEPFFFLKPATAVNDPGADIVLPPASDDVNYEGELALVISRRASKVPVEDAMDHVLGWTLMNDVTARDIQAREPCYTRAKGYDSFAPLGPDVVVGGDPNDFRLRTYLNDELRQDSGCNDLIFPVPLLVSFVSHVMTLEPGDVLSTGTPAGVGRMQPGDVVRVTIDGIGELANPVVAP